jgi:hypothetical protein
MRARGKDKEAMLAYLRARGCSKVDSIRVIMAVLDLGLERAERAVHSSKTWADVRARRSLS